MEQGSTTVVDTPTKRPPKRAMFLVVVVVLLLALAAIAVLLLTRITTPSLSGTALLRAVNTDSTDGHSEQAIALIDHSKGESTAAKERLTATVYANAHQYSQALAVYAELKAAGQLTASDAQNAATIAASDKNDALAASYYDLAAGLVAKDGHDPVGNADATYDRVQAERLTAEEKQ